MSPLFSPSAQGPRPYRFTHDGQANFIVWLHCAGGDDLGQNEIGPLDVTSVVRFAQGPCLWEVRADGNWSITPAQ